MSPDFYELWRSVMSICVITEEATGYVSTWMGDRLSALLVSLMLVDQNPFWPCYTPIFLPAHKSSGKLMLQSCSILMVVSVMTTVFVGALQT